MQFLCRLPLGCPFEFPLFQVPFWSARPCTDSKSIPFEQGVVRSQCFVPLFPGRECDLGCLCPIIVGAREDRAVLHLSELLQVLQHSAAGSLCESSDKQAASKVMPVFPDVYIFRLCARAMVCNHTSPRLHSPCSVPSFSTSFPLPLCVLAARLPRFFPLFFPHSVELPLLPAGFPMRRPARSWFPRQGDHFPVSKLEPFLLKDFPGPIQSPVS